MGEDLPVAEKTVEAAVDDYVKRHRRRAKRELEEFTALRTDQEAVSRAALAELPNGKRHPHQRRIPRVALEASERRLLVNLPQLRRARTFDELFDLVEALIAPIPNIGELTVYDTALRIGARLGLEPDKVYVHAGTRDGARALGLDVEGRAIEMSELPKSMQRLSAREAEDFLCGFKIKPAAK